MFSQTLRDKQWLLFGGAVAFTINTIAFALCYRFTYQYGYFLGLRIDYHNLFYFSYAFIFILCMNGLIPLLLSSFFLWIKRFPTRLQNGLFALFIISFSTASVSISFIRSLQAIIYFIAVNNLVYLPIVWRLSLVPNTATTWQTTIETKAQNKRYWLLFFLVILFGGAIGGLFDFFIMLLVSQPSFKDLTELLPILYFVVLLAAVYGTIPALATMWAVVLLRLQRNVFGITLCLFIGVTFATLFGAVIVYTQDPYDFFTLSPRDLTLFTQAGGIVSAIIAYCLPKPTNAQAKYGISALEQRKKLARIVVGVTAIYLLLAMPISYWSDSSYFYNDVSQLSPRAFFATLNKHFCIGLPIASIIALIFNWIRKVKQP